MRHLVRWLDIQGQMGHDAKSTERDHRATKVLSIEISSQFEEVPVRKDQLHCGDRGGENTLSIARTVGASCAGPGDRDLGDRGHIRKCETCSIQRTARSV